LHSCCVTGRLRSLPRRDPADWADGEVVTGSLYNSTMPDFTPSQSPGVPVLDKAALAPSAGARRAPDHRPRPDVVTICSVTVPHTAPPYDDAAPPTRRTKRAVRAGPVPSSAGRIAPSPVIAERSAGPAECPPADHWPSQFAQVLAETLAGSRPPSQLTPWTTEQARKRISQLGTVLATAHQPRVKRVIVRSPTDGVLEMAVVVWLGTRVRALAVRLERDRPAESPRPLPQLNPTATPPAQPPPAQPPPASTTPTPALSPLTPPVPAFPPQATPAPATPAPAARWYCTAIEAV
jgi:hypothetical protein